jgi:hypothetical protein
MYVNNVTNSGLRNVLGSLNTQKYVQSFSATHDHFELYPELRATSEGFKNKNSVQKKEMLLIVK